MNNKSKATREDFLNGQIDKAMGVMLNYGFLGLTREKLVKDTAAMNFFKGVLRQHELRESEIEEVVNFLQSDKTV